MSDRADPCPRIASVPERWHVNAVPQSLPVRRTKNKAASMDNSLRSCRLGLSCDFRVLTVDTWHDDTALLPQTLPVLGTGCPSLLAGACNYRDSNTFVSHDISISAILLHEFRTVTVAQELLQVPSTFWLCVIEMAVCITH